MGVVGVLSEGGGQQCVVVSKGAQGYVCLGGRSQDVAVEKKKRTPNQPIDGLSHDVAMQRRARWRNVRREVTQAKFVVCCDGGRPRGVPPGGITTSA